MAPRDPDVKERDQGWIGSNKTQVTFQYGESIKWKKMKMGGYAPYFEEGTYRMKNFHVWDSEVDEPAHEAGEQYQKRVDPLRDFYYMSEEETATYLRGVAGGDAAFAHEKGTAWTQEEQDSVKKAQNEAFTSYASKDDESWSDYWHRASPKEAIIYAGERGAYVDQLQDIRKTLEFVQDYRYSDQGSLHTGDFGMNEFEGSREFRQAVNDHNYLGLKKDSSVTFHSGSAGVSGFGEMGTVDRIGYNYKDFGGRLEGKTAEEVQEAGKSWYQNSKEMRLLSDMYFEQRKLLYKTQKAAGTSMGFNELYGKYKPDYHPTHYLPDGSFTVSRGGKYDTYYGFTEGDYMNIKDNGWALYQDGTWEFGDLDTADDLKHAIEKIEASGSMEWKGSAHYRNSDQRSYLAQKAYTRYLYSKINQLGGHDYTFVHGSPREVGPYKYRNQDMSRPGALGGWKPAISGPMKWEQTLDGVSKWALDPMYSEVDDGNLDRDSYGTEVIHRDDYKAPDRTGQPTLGQGGEKLHNLKAAGYFGEGEDNPDYVAGRYKDVYEFNMAKGGHEFSGWDEGKHTYVGWGYQTPGSVYNPETNNFDMPAGWVDPMDWWTPPEEEEQDKTEFIKGDDDWITSLYDGHHDNFDDGHDYEVPFGWYIDYEGDGLLKTIPDGWEIDEDGNLVRIAYVPTEEELRIAQEAADKAAQEAADKAAQEAADKAAQEAADKAAQDAQDAADKAAQDAADKAAQDAADRAAAAKAAQDAAAAAAAKGPDYIAPVHSLQHFAKNPDAPGHIPMGLISLQIAEGVKNI